MQRQRSTTIIKTSLFGAVLLFLCLPYIQRKFVLVEEKPLYGYVEQVAKPELTATSFFEEEFQKQYERYVNQQYGFRTSLVRLRNQVDYSFFNLSNTNDVVIGKNHCLYEGSYIRAYYGDDYMGNEAMQRSLDRLRMVRDTLAKLNVKLLFVMTPDKASFYPEYFPDAYVEGHDPPPYRTNYEEWMRGLKKHAVPAIDFRRWFLGMKKTTKYPLYAMGGIHWSKYGAYIAADSLLRYMDKLTGKRVPQLRLDSIVVSAENAPEDYDIAEGMNMIFRMPTRPMAYPVFHRESLPGMQQPSVLVAGDSYYFLLHGYKLSEKHFNDGQFWYYGQEIVHTGPLGGKLVKDIAIQKEIERQDVVVIFSTNRNLNGFAAGFVNTLYEAYFPEKKKR